MSCYKYTCNQYWMALQDYSKKYGKEPSRSQLQVFLANRYYPVTEYYELPIEENHENN